MFNQPKRVRARTLLGCALALGAISHFQACGGNEKGGNGSAAGGATFGGGSGAQAGSNNVIGGGTSETPEITVDRSDASAAQPSSTPHACVNLECQQTGCTLGNCQQKACASGTNTTVHGTVFDPAGKVPLYNVIVYVPNDALPALTTGASCDRCDARVISPVTSAITDTHGNFVLNDVPVGKDIPLVMQVGKWRRQIKIPSVAACADTALTDVNLTRLPRNKSEGDIPQMAIAVGGADSMECLPRRMGIDDAEFTTETGNGRIHLYSGHDWAEQVVTKAFAPALNGGATFTRTTQLWRSLDQLKKYDLVILSCEGNAIAEEKPVAARKAMYDYESLGGRVFGSHFQRIWFSDGPAPVPQIGTWRDYDDPPSPIAGKIDTSFPKGQALSEWLVNVGASTTPGQLSIIKARDNIQAVDPALARSWITIQAPGGRGSAAHTSVQYLSYNAPLKAAEEMQCGRAVYNDLHVSATGGDKPGTVFPDGCEKRDLTAQEKAVEFMLFDLSGCLQDDAKPPVPPMVN